MKAEELISELRSSQTDLARFVEAVIRDSMPYVVVQSEAVRAWQRREPQASRRGGGGVVGESDQARVARCHARWVSLATMARATVMSRMPTPKVRRPSDGAQPSRWTCPRR